jgi:hypothetical protein
VIGIAVVFFFGIVVSLLTRDPDEEKALDQCLYIDLAKEFKIKNLFYKATNLVIALRWVSYLMHFVRLFILRSFLWSDLKRRKKKCKMTKPS